WFEGRDFEKTTLEPVLGNGPYKISKVDPGRSITFERVKNYWGADLPTQKGMNNYDEIRYDYYRDATVALEAFKAGEYDFREENISKNWLSAYDIPPVKDGRIIKTLIPHSRPTGMQGFAMNTRRPQFADERVREAMSLAFDFEWANKNLFGGTYTRTESYFSNSELAATGLPTGKELAILEEYRDQLPPEVFTKEFKAPSTAGKNGLRMNLRRATQLLKEAGWEVKQGKRVNAKTGQAMSFELLLVSPSFERVALPFARNLKRLGIDVRVRVVDTSQYQQRLDEFDFDMVALAYGQSLSPGNEQRNMWTTEAAETKGSRNLIGIKDPVVDALVDRLIAARDREELINLTRALDRVLLWGHYVVPHWHIRAYRVVYWDKFGRPDVIPPYDLGFEGWWIKPESR
ncbi:MAG: extracellular solute-binding protein, partial [Gammaproteobacteria bacterium]